MTKYKVVMSAGTKEDLIGMLADFWCSSPSSVRISDDGEIYAPNGNKSTFKYRVKRGRHQVVREV